MEEVTWKQGSVLLLRREMVKFTFSYITFFCLNWPGIVKNLTGKRKKVMNIPFTKLRPFYWQKKNGKTI